MKLTIQIALLAVMAWQATAQTNKPAFIKGDMDIKFNTRTSLSSDGKPNKGVTDVYRLHLNVSDSAVFKGNIAYTPHLAGTLGVAQPASLNYLLECDVVNPANPTQTKNVGRLYGIVPVDASGAYRFSDGTLRIGVHATGRAQGFESKFTGVAMGRPLVKSSGFFASLKKEAMNLSKQVKGKTVTIIVKKYDKMTFVSHTLGAGPVQIYPESTVNGEMVYDYARLAWYFNNVTVSYLVDGRQLIDKLSGNIRWTESPQRKSNGEGEYQFDVRVNDPPPNESTVFAGASDEAAFFQTDDTVAALTGTMKYKDAIIGDTVTGSVVSVNLQGNKLTRVQTMNLAKLILLSSVVPLNAE